MFGWVILNNNNHNKGDIIKQIKSYKGKKDKHQ